MECASIQYIGCLVINTVCVCGVCVCVCVMTNLNERNVSGRSSHGLISPYGSSCADSSAKHRCGDCSFHGFAKNTFISAHIETDNNVSDLIEDKTTLIIDDTHTDQHDSRAFKAFTHGSRPSGSHFAEGVFCLCSGFQRNLNLRKKIAQMAVVNTLVGAMRDGISTAPEPNLLPKPNKVP